MSKIEFRRHRGHLSKEPCAVFLAMVLWGTEMRSYVCCLIVAGSVNAAAWCADRNVVVAAAKSEAVDQPVEVRDFEVKVDNKAVGTHRLKIKSMGSTQQVEMQTDVKVDIIIYAYVFKLRGTEVWRDGRVEDADIRCDDGGKKRSLTLKPEGSGHALEFNGKPVAAGASRFTMTTAYWRLPPKELREKAFPIVDVDRGKSKEATIVLVGPDTVAFSGRSLACRHFQIDGPSPADFWFDDQNCLVRQKSIEQGHQTELILKQIRLSKDGN